MAMHRFALCLALIAGACLGPAAAEDAAPPADAQAPAATVVLAVPPGAQAGPDFDVERATQAWVETLTPEQRARSKAYFEGGYWLQLFSFLYGLAMAWVFLHLRVSARMRDIGIRVSGNATVQSMVYGALYVPAA